MEKDEPAASASERSVPEDAESEVSTEVVSGSVSTDAPVAAAAESQRSESSTELQAATSDSSQDVDDVQEFDNKAPTQKNGEKKTEEQSKASLRAEDSASGDVVTEQHPPTKMSFSWEPRTKWPSYLTEKATVTALETLQITANQLSSIPKGTTPSFFPNCHCLRP